MVYRTKNFIFILILLSLVSTNIVMADNLIIDNLKNSSSNQPKEEFCENQSTKWCFVTDKVMGGVSNGSLKLKITKNINFYNMSGNVSTENNGGFIQFRTNVINHPKNKLYKGVRIKVRGNNQEYAVHVRTKYLFLPWQYYESIFIATNEWESIELPFENFKKSNFYQPSSIASSDIKTVGIVAIGRNFTADIDLAQIEFY
ncbi:MAG: NADH ubiquinone oxidoreductase [Gammaproteobacteria bacterium]|nr:NADH ubiquinone oxidoreductase [Gammaproteobacteria bacterium]|tara:strand:- start:3028 stop:3630 length:603 start_codon:yes stop_codon:yes gene_type:complete